MFYIPKQMYFNFFSEQGINHHGFAKTLRNPEKIIGRRHIARESQLFARIHFLYFHPKIRKSLLICFVTFTTSLKHRFTLQFQKIVMAI